MAPVPFQSKASDKGENHYDLIVIGGGSGGLGAARRAAQYGAKVRDVFFFVFFFFLVRHADHASGSFWLKDNRGH